MKNINALRTAHEIEAALQRQFEEILRLIKKLKADTREKSAITIQLGDYRTLWNGYVRIFKDKIGDTRQSAQRHSRPPYIDPGK